MYKVPEKEKKRQEKSQRARKRPDTAAVINSDEEIKKRSKDAGDEQEETDETGGAFFGDAFIRDHNLTGDNPGGKSDRDRFAKYRNMVQTSESSLAQLRKAKKEKIHDIQIHSDSEEDMKQAIDYEILVGDAKEENLRKDYLKKVDRQTGDDEMETRFQTSQEARRIRGEIAQLKHEQMTVKDRYNETYPGDTQTMRSKLKAKAQKIHGQSLRERTGQSIDREPDEGFW